MHHREPLSHSLESLLVPAESGEPLTLNQMVERTEGRGLYLFLVLICLPFISPIPLPGFSMVIGLVVFVVGLRIALGLPPRLPSFIGNRQIPVERQRRIIAASVKWVKRIEKMAKPRGRGWISNQAAHRANALLIAFLGLVLTLPLPIPFTNSLPALGVIFLCVSMMEEDALLVWVGYGFAAGSVIYLMAISGAVIELFHRFIELLHKYFA